MPGPTHLNTLAFQTIKVMPVTMTSILIEWALEPTAASLAGLSFTVEQSGGVDGPWDILTTGLVASSWLDTTANLRNKHRTYFYRVQALFPPNAPTISPVSTWKNTIDRVGFSIVSRLNMVLRNTKGKGIGIKFTHYPVRTWGQRCPDCYDIVKQRLSESNCATCFGTNWVGGFWSPGLAYGSIQSRPALTELGWQELNPNESAILFSSHPPLHVRDILIDKENAVRWRVVRINSTTKKDITVHQMARVSQVIPDDVEYQLAPLP